MSRPNSVWSVFWGWVKREIFRCSCLLLIVGCTPQGRMPEPAASPAPKVSSSGLKLRLPAMPTYLCYYGGWTEEALDKAKRFPLVIAKQGTSASEVTKLKSSGAKVVLYVSVGEEDVDVRDKGDGQGPIRCEGTKKVFTKKGVDSQYVRIADGREKGGYGSWYTDGGNPLWQRKVLAESKRLIGLGADGIFLDTIDTAANTDDGAPCTASGMLDLVVKLREALPDKYIIGNRGLFYLDPGKSSYSAAYRQAVSGVMFENLYTSWKNGRGEKSGYWESSHLPATKYVQTEATKPDGFTVLALDYFNRSQLRSSLLKEQQAEVAKLGWVNSISDIDLTEIYETLLEKK